jgi:phosphoribosylglycinamide formyltransferase-1
MKVCFLVSGEGGNLKFFHLVKELGFFSHLEISVIADRECGAARFAQKNGLYTKTISYQQDYTTELLHELEQITPNIIVTNWNKIIDPDTVHMYEGQLINLHYSLLPSFKGLIGTAPIKKAYEQNCKFIGATCHFVNEHVDSGKIIGQAIAKTDKPFEKAVQEIFRKGAMLLLNCILILSGSKMEISIEREQSECDFSPGLLFDRNLFSSSFWQRLEKL